jgi:membrane protein DedA with SNARE-associated domain
MLATFGSEDLTCIAVGLMIGAGQLDTLVGLSGCFLGIYLGDLGLWMIGFLVGLGLLRLSFVGRVVSVQRREELRRWLDRRGSVALLAARFLPGTRLPLYLASGLLGQSFRRFALWTLLAALVWTPALVILVSFLGEGVAAPAKLLLGTSWLTALVAAVILFLMIRVAALACTTTGRGKLMARISRLWRWEFWPSWLFYLPVLPWLAYLALRYRGVLTWTAANPGIPTVAWLANQSMRSWCSCPRIGWSQVRLSRPENPAAGWLRFDR